MVFLTMMPKAREHFLWIFPILLHRVSSIQIQRGVGTSSNGAGAFGATINFSTNEINHKAYAEFNNSFGSFNTWKNTLKAGSGLIDDHFTADIRLSGITSDGYIDRASQNSDHFIFLPLILIMQILVAF